MGENFMKVLLEKLLACEREQYAEGAFVNAMAIAMSAFDATSSAWDEIGKRYAEKGLTRTSVKNWSLRVDVPDAVMRRFVAVRLRMLVQAYLNAEPNVPPVGASWESMPAGAANITAFEVMPKTDSGVPSGPPEAARTGTVYSLPVVQPVPRREREAMPKAPVLKVAVVKKSPEDVVRAKAEQEKFQREQMIGEWKAFMKSLSSVRDEASWRQCLLTLSENFGERMARSLNFSAQHRDYVRMLASLRFIELCREDQGRWNEILSVAREYLPSELKRDLNVDAPAIGPGGVPKAEHAARLYWALHKHLTRRLVEFR